jgi:hypothetical protein
LTAKTDFTEQEWETLEKGVTGAGFWMAISDRGFFDTFKEANALAKHLREAHEKASSDFVRELAATRETGFGWRSSPEEIEQQTTQALQSAVQTLESKAPDELDAYRQLVLEIAESVGKAAAGGESAESATLEKIRAAVGG